MVKHILVTSFMVAITAATVATTARAQTSPAANQTSRELTTKPTDPAVQENLEQVNRIVRLARQGVADPEVREQFVQIEQIARSPEADQVTALPKLYRRLMTPALMHPNVERGLHSIPGKLLERDQTIATSRIDVTAMYSAELDQAAARMTPGQVADQIATISNSAVLAVAARRRAMHVLGRNIDAATPLINDEFSSTDPAQIRHALAVVSAMELNDFVPQITQLLVRAGPLASFAARALDAFHPNPEFARPILEDLSKNPAAIARYQSVLKTMFTASPPDEVVLQLLDSPDADIRSSAATVLEWTDETSAQAILPKLMADKDERVRVIGLGMAFRMQGDSFQKIRSLVMASLFAPGIRERCRAAYGLGMKRDSAGAKVLLECAKDADLPTDLRQYVSSSTKTLMGIGPEPFWFSPGQWGPDVPQNARAIERLEKWIAENVKN